MYLAVENSSPATSFSLWRQHDKHLEEDVQAYVDVIFRDLPITEQILEEIRSAQENDPLCQEVVWHC